MVCNIRTIVYLCLATLLSYSAAAQQTFDTCSVEGSAVRSDVRRLNVKKNRYDIPTDAQINRKVDFHTLLMSGEHPSEFKEGDAVEIVAYVSDVKIGAVESVNCKSSDAWHRDTHIELTLDPMNSGNKEQLLIAEVTPRFREIMKARSIDWSQKGLRDQFLGRWVVIRGWAFYDAMHDDESAGSGSGRIWRGSPWEVHPITNISVTTRPTKLPSKPLPSVQQKPVKQEMPQGLARQCEGTTQKGARCKRTVSPPDRHCYQHKP